MNISNAVPSIVFLITTYESTLCLILLITMGWCYSVCLHSMKSKNDAAKTCVISLLTTYAIISHLSHPSGIHATLYLFESDMLFYAVFSSTPLKPCLMLCHFCILDNYLDMVTSMLFLWWQHITLHYVRFIAWSLSDCIVHTSSSWWPGGHHAIYIIFLMTIHDNNHIIFS